ncbi:hypothetical protein I3842_05G133000 [Carya illinoinensis]|uniref:Uncharacterized protein n=1 Tax=Carya illinoinensis TaxID=32201 RepID=A0A922F0K8_CARIL|nr:hypothetical protein I3842_05G133000 [Carya illinoinensis]
MYRTSHWRWNIDMNMDHFIYKVVMELIGAAEKKQGEVQLNGEAEVTQTTISFCVSHFTVAEYHFQQTFQMLKKMCHSKEVIKK